RWEILSPDGHGPDLSVCRGPITPEDWEDYRRAMEDQRTPDDWAHAGHWGDRFSYCHNLSRPPVQSPNLELVRLLHLLRPQLRAKAQVPMTKRQRRSSKGGFQKAFNQQLRAHVYVRLLLCSPLLVWTLTTSTIRRRSR